MASPVEGHLLSQGARALQHRSTDVPHVSASHLGPEKPNLLLGHLPGGDASVSQAGDHLTLSLSTLFPLSKVLRQCWPQALLFYGW